MFDNIVLVFAAAALGWSLINFLRADRPVAVGAAISATVLCAAFAASTVQLPAWLEGGFGMNVLALSGSYALGAAGAFLLSGTAGTAGARRAALIAAGLTAVLAGVFYVDGLRGLDDVLLRADASDRELILEATRGELRRLLELGGGLTLATALMLVGGRRNRGPRGMVLNSQTPDFIDSSR